MSFLFYKPTNKSDLYPVSYILYPVSCILCADCWTANAPKAHWVVLKNTEGVRSLAKAAQNCAVPLA